MVENNSSISCDTGSIFIHLKAPDMPDNFFLVLAAVLLLPLIPAYVLYKFLPASETDVSGPYQGLSIKLKGAFAGYFLLLLACLGLYFLIVNNKDKKTIEALNRKVNQQSQQIQLLRKQVNNAVTDWYVRGLITPPGNTGTRFFYDDGTTMNNPDGSFELIKRSLGKEGLAQPPKWICIYDAKSGFKVISLNRAVNHPDIQAYGISFDDQKHEVLIRQPIEVNSIARDSIVAVANFVNQNPELKSKVQQLSPDLFQKADVIRRDQQIERAKMAPVKAPKS